MGDTRSGTIDGLFVAPAPRLKVARNHPRHARCRATAAVATRATERRGALNAAISARVRKSSSPVFWGGARCSTVRARPARRRRLRRSSRSPISGVVPAARSSAARVGWLDNAITRGAAARRASSGAQRRPTSPQPAISTRARRSFRVAIMLSIVAASALAFVSSNSSRIYGFQRYAPAKRPAVSGRT